MIDGVVATAWSSRTPGLVRIDIVEPRRSLKDNPGDGRAARRRGAIDATNSLEQRLLDGVEV